MREREPRAGSGNTGVGCKETAVGQISRVTGSWVFGRGSEVGLWRASAVTWQLPSRALYSVSQLSSFVQWNRVPYSELHTCSLAAVKGLHCQER